MGNTVLRDDTQQVDGSPAIAAPPSKMSRLIRGCGYLDGYGAHPGVAPLLTFALMGAVAGMSRAGWRGALFGIVAMLVVFGPMFLWGAYGRAKSYDQGRGGYGR